jgi:hypothetical protein
MKNKFILGLILVMLALPNCKKSNNSGNSDNLEVPDSVVNKGTLEISDQAIENMTQNISSPIETAALIKSLNVPFSRNFIASTDDIDHYNTNFKQALILGIYGADLGYLNMYGKTSVAIDFLSSIKKLSNKLKIGQFFDFQTIKRLASSNENVDSLIYISQRNFNQMYKYLRENNRSNISVLMMAGVWIEGLYLTGQVYNMDPDPELREAIGEQKIMLSDLMILLRNYERDPDFASLIEDYEDIYDLFKKVKITYEQGEPEQVVEDGKLIIKQNTKSIVNISDELLQKIIKRSTKIRNKLINE